MGEFKERRWAVMSERGCEAAGLTYTEAASLVGELKREGLSGLCVITEEAASHLPRVAKGNGRRPASDEKPKRQRRASRKKGEA